MKEECLICKAPLEYQQEDVLMECSYAEEIIGIKMQKPQVFCRHMSSNSQCIGKRCPFPP